MTPAGLILRSLRHYWRTNLAVLAGVGTVVAVLAGALLVGVSVRASLRDLALARLGGTDVALAATGFVREALADELTGRASTSSGRAEPVEARVDSAAFRAAAPLIALEGSVAHEPSGRSAHRIQVFAVDTRFWRLHGVATVDGPEDRDAYLSPALQTELATRSGDALRLTVPQASDISPSVLQGRRGDLVRTIRLVARDFPRPRELATGAFGPEESARGAPRPDGTPAIAEFSLRPQQGDVRAMFVSLRQLQRDLRRPGQANLLLLAARRSVDEEAASAATAQAATALLRAAARVEDLGLRVRRVNSSAATVVVESARGYLSDVQARAIEDVAAQEGLRPVSVLTYLANSIRVGERAIPYSTVSAIDLPDTVPSPQSSALEPGSPVLSPQPSSLVPQSSILSPRSSFLIHLNTWAAEELRPQPGDRVVLDFYVWTDDGGLQTESAEFTFGRVVSMSGVGADPTLTPDYPGLTDAARLRDWDPPFRVDLSRIQKRDEDYWERYRAAPKAFVPLTVGQALWATRFGRLTSIRLTAPEDRRPIDISALERDLATRLDPSRSGAFTVLPVRADAVRAAQGTTDFGRYFLYFSFFLVVSALLLAATFFRLGVEQRWREIGLLRALGYRDAQILGFLLAEGVALAVVGGAAGVSGALGYSALVLLGLRTSWAGAVGTTRLAVHVSAWPLVVGFAGGVLVAVAAIAVTLGGLRRVSPRTLLASSAGSPPAVPTPALRRVLRRRALAGAAAAVLVLVATAAGVIPPAGGFFGGGSLLLLAALVALAARLQAVPAHLITPRGSWSLARLGFRAASAHPGRTVLSAALIALATFIIVAVGAFRREGVSSEDRQGGTGGYSFVAESVVPLVHDPGTRAGLEELGVPADALGGLRIVRVRLKPGDEGSCLNLYRPQSPRMLGAPPAFVREGRFSFAASLAETDEERDNPWRLLEREFADGALPAIADATSLTYVYHLGIGDEVVVPGPGGQSLRLRIVAALRDSVFQSELIIAERHFVRLFPYVDGYRVFLVETTPAARASAAATLEQAFRAHGLDVEETAARLAAFHRVENTYLSTFQTLGALGLVLGTFGVGAVLLRNVLERQRELALLGAVGFRGRHLSLMILAETALLVVAGVGTGTACALVAVAPAVAERGTPLPVASLTLLVAGVALAALLSVLGATVVVRRLPIVATLHTE